MDYWKAWSDEICEVLGLEGKPVAVAYSREPSPIANGRRQRACDALRLAAAGQVFDITFKNSRCFGGDWHLGLSSPPEGKKWEALKEFIIKGEKLFRSGPALETAVSSSAPPPRDLGDRIIFSPLDKAEFLPQIIVFLCNAEQGSRLVTLYSYATGVPVRAEMTLSTCHQTIAYPITTGELNVSLMDYTCRKRFKPEQLFVSIPYDHFAEIMEIVDECSAGRAKIEVTGFVDAGVDV